MHTVTTRSDATVPALRSVAVVLAFAAVAVVLGSVTLRRRTP